MELAVMWQYVVEYTVENKHNMSLEWMFDYID